MDVIRSVGRRPPRLIPMKRADSQTMMRRPPWASATWWPPELKPTKRPLLEDHLEPELNPARVVRVDERERVALKLVWPGWFESLKVKGTIQQVQCGAGVRAG